MRADTATLWVVFLACAALGWLLHSWLGPQPLPDPAVQRLELEVDSLVAQARQDSAAAAARDTAAARQVRELTRQVTAHRKAELVARGTVELLVDSLAIMVPDTLRPVVARLQQAHQAQVLAFTGALAAQDSIIRTMDRQLADAQGLNTTLWRALAKTDSLRAHWQHQAQPSTLTRLRRSVPGLLVAAGVGAILASN